MRTDTDRIVVIGGGLGGLAAAAVLAARGHRVLIMERNSWLGGKAARLEEAGFRFDMGPTILTVPAVLERIFAEAGERLQEHLPLTRLNPQWRCFFADGRTLDLEEDLERMARNLRAFSPGRDLVPGYRQFQALAARLHDISQRFFFWKSIEGLRDTMAFRESLRPSTLADILSLRMGQCVAGAIRTRVPDEQLAQMLDHFTQYVGSSPFASPAVLCAIAHMQTSGGVWYPAGGTHGLVRALLDLTQRLGVEIACGEEVERIVVRQQRVASVVTRAGREIPAAAVVSNMDAVRTYRELIGGAAGASYGRARYQPACSGVVLYLGLSRAYEHLLHHNFIFSADAQQEFACIYRRGEPAPDPTCYVAAPARTDPGVAPAGGEALYVLVHTPALRPQHDWSALLPGYRRIILDKLAGAGMPDLESRIVFEQVLTPEDIHSRYKVLQGAIYGLASHGRFLGAFKPGNRSRCVRGLYLAGGAAHPGPGMPMVMMSGWIAADAADQDMKGATALAAPHPR